MIRNVIVAIVLLVNVSFSQEALKLEVAEQIYSPKDNVFVTVSGHQESLRLKVFNPKYELIEAYPLQEMGRFFLQVSSSGKYFIEASDAKADVFEFVEVLNGDITKCPKSQIGKDIYAELDKILYIGVSSDCLEIAKIFAKNKGKEPAQKLIDDTFKEIKEYLKDNPSKKEWEDFFEFIHNYYVSLAIPSNDMAKYRSLWEDTEEAFKCKGENP